MKMRTAIILGILTASCASGAEDLPALKQRVTALERDVAALKEENNKLREDAAAEERKRARKIYSESVVPMLKPMLKDFGLDESLLVPVEKIETMADAYRPLILMIRKLSEVAELK